MPKVIFSFFGFIYLIAATLTLISQGRFWPVAIGVFICTLSAIVVMSIAFFIGHRIKRYDVVDVAWGFSFISISITSFLLSYQRADYITVCAVVTLLVVVWGLRLSIHILRRIRATKKQDWRYDALMRGWKKNVAWNMFFRVYMLQAVLAVVVCIPIIHINLFLGTAWTPWAIVGVIVWLCGFIFESVADKQLREFVAKSRNKSSSIMTKGLWRYSRHPNYFGEITQWWGVFIIALGVPYGWVGVIGPAMITFLIVYISGLPFHEKRFATRPGWNEYKLRTSALIPFPPRR